LARQSATFDVVLVRSASPSDVPIVTVMIEELAHYERLGHEAVATESDIERALFGEDSHVSCHVVEIDNEIVGFALWFLNFSTFQGVPGIYLEDLYVRESHRGRGLGTALMVELARLCVERGYTRFQWWVLNWNKPSIGFYESMGAVSMNDWTVYRLSGEALSQFAQRQLN
jgi:GNAT superfamily N-acetyltransferase